MNNYEIKYEEIKRNGVIRDQIISGEIIREVENYFKIDFSNSFLPNMTNTSKLMNLIGSEYRDYVIKLLEQNDYNLRAELYYLLGNLCNGANPKYMKYFNSIIDSDANDFVVMLNTIFGHSDILKLNRVMPQLRRFVAQQECHNLCEIFIKYFNEYTATTVLLDTLFGGKHYHSFVENDDHVLDLAANAYMKRNEYYQLFNPIVLNSIKQEELKNAEEEINEKENIGKDKCLLLRLAVNKQIK